MKNKLIKLTFGTKYIEYKCGIIFVFLMNKMKKNNIEKRINKSDSITI
jgi:hypothetical protein